MNQIIQPITVVSGLPRSGTSMMMRMLEAGGIEPLTDGVRRPNEDNPRGYYELEAVKGLGRSNTYPHWLMEARGKAVKIVSPLLRFLPRDFQYQIILMRRRIEEIMASQRIMLRNRGERTDPAGEKKLVRIYQRDLREIEQWMSTQPNIRALFVSYNGLMLEPAAEIERVSAFLSDRDLDLDAMAEVIEPALYRQRR